MLHEGELSRYAVMTMGGPEMEGGNYKSVDYCCTVRAIFGEVDYSCLVSVNSRRVYNCTVDTSEEQITVVQQVETLGE